MGVYEGLQAYKIPGFGVLGSQVWASKDHAVAGYKVPEMNPPVRKE